MFNCSKEALNVLKNTYLALEKPAIGREYWTGFIWHDDISW